MIKNIVFITGLSGSGKSFIKDKLVNLFPDKYYTIIQYTTREMRDNEQNGIDYNFISKEEYNELKDSLFCKTKLNNNFYGTPITFIEDKIALIVVNASGLEDGINFIEKNKDSFNYIILDIINNSPIERKDRNKNFVEQERKDIDSLLYKISNNKIIKLINESDHYLKAEDVNTIIQYSI